MKNIYLIIRLNSCDYDEYDGFVVLHKNKKKALELVEKYQRGNWKIKKIGESTKEFKKPRLFLNSFRAG